MIILLMKFSRFSHVNQQKVNNRITSICCGCRVEVKTGDFCYMKNFLFDLGEQELAIS